jgi:hypothetical protein
VGKAQESGKNWFKPSSSRDPCPSCRRGDGVPISVTASHASKDVIVGLRCNTCSHQWQAPHQLQELFKPPKNY